MTNIKNEKLSNNFSLLEMVQSSTTNKLNIDNSPSKEAYNNICKLVTYILQPIRNKYDKPIVVKSGYRCKKLNSAVGGVSNSDHLYGAAADIKATDGNNIELWNTIKNMVANGEILCRQIIWEYGTKTNPKWIHVSINNLHNTTQKNKYIYYYDK